MALIERITLLISALSTPPARPFDPSVPAWRASSPSDLQTRLPRACVDRHRRRRGLPCPHSRDVSDIVWPSASDTPGRKVTYAATATLPKRAH